MCLTKLSKNELDELYSYIKTIMGGAGEPKVDVHVNRDEIKVVVCRASKVYQGYLEQWFIENNFGNLQGTTASRNFTYLFVQDNFTMAQRMSNWFASMMRIGVDIPWKKDYVNLVP